MVQGAAVAVHGRLSPMMGVDALHGVEVVVAAVSGCCLGDCLGRPAPGAV